MLDRLNKFEEKAKQGIDISLTKVQETAKNAAYFSKIADQVLHS